MRNPATKFGVLATFVSVALSACSDQPRSVMAATVTGATAAESLVAEVRAASTARAAAVKRLSITINFEGAGPLHPGMSLAKSVMAMEGDLYTQDTELACSYFMSARTPGMKYLYLDRHLARIEVDSGTVATPERVRIGSTEGDVQAAYGGRVTVTSDAYSPTVHYMTVSAPEGGSSNLKLVFETDGKRVVRYRSGVTPAVGWVEGCN